MKTRSVVLTIESEWNPVVWPLIKMKPLRQYFCMVLFVFQYFTKWNLDFFLNFKSFNSQECQKLIPRDSGSTHLYISEVLAVAGLSRGVGAALKSEATGEPERRPSADAPHPAPQPTYPSNVPDPVGSKTSHGAPGTEYFFFKPSMTPFSGWPSGASRATFFVTVATCSANQLREWRKGKSQMWQNAGFNAEYHSRGRVFRQDIQTTRSGLKFFFNPLRDVWISEWWSTGVFDITS